MLDFIVPGRPQGKARPRMTRSGHCYTPQKTVAYEAEICAACRQAMQGSGERPYTGEIALLVIAVYPIPARTPKGMREAMERGKIRPRTKPDIDNIVKVVADACNGVAYLDDKQITAVHASKIYGLRPYVRVQIEGEEREAI